MKSVLLDMSCSSVTVIVPAYNIDSYLARTLDSILSQTYQNLEIIIVNDGSTDKTGEIGDSYAEKDSRIIVIHKKNEGVSCARNVGIDRARGDYIGFVDGDDTIEADMYEFLLDNAIKHDADISHCGHTMITAQGDVPHYGTGTIKQQDMATGILDLLEGRLVDPGLWTKIYKRHLFDDLRLVPGLRINEDLLINYYLFKRSRGSIFEDVSKYNYIKRDGSASMSEIAPYRVRDFLKVAKEIMEDAVDNPIIFPRAEYRYLMTLFELCKGLTLSCDVGMTDVKSELFQELSARCKRYASNCLVGRKYVLFVGLLMRFPFGFRILYSLYKRKPR